jgi:glutaredoxin
MTKALVVTAFVVAFVVARRWHLARAARLRADQAPVPTLPDSLVGDADRTWVVFTTRFCAQCGPVEALLRSREPDAQVVKVDAEREPALARAFRIQSAPTVLLANGAGVVQHRFVGADAVRSYFA